MDINEAFLIVLDLAGENVISVYDHEDENARQLAAIEAVMEFARGHGVTFIE